MPAAGRVNWKHPKKKISQKKKTVGKILKKMNNKYAYFWGGEQSKTGREKVRENMKFGKLPVSNPSYPFCGP